MNIIIPVIGGLFLAAFVFNEAREEKLSRPRGRPRKPAPEDPPKKDEKPEADPPTE